MRENLYKFQKLTPISNVDLSIYSSALDFIFENDDIKNVAISGAYSAGKSSVLETYKITHKNIKFYHISLAHFELTKQNNVPDTVNSESILEGKILNQLIHQIDPEKIPQTHFKVKRKVSSEKVTKNTALTITFLILAAYITNFGNWCRFVSSLSIEGLKRILGSTTNSDLVVLSGLISITILGAAIFKLIKAQNYINIFKKVNLQGNIEIEVFEEENKNESYFDKYLNEVLYLFENSGADVIVFEDIDRYNVNQIFEKLREINTLVNYKNKKPIRFFYLLRDDIFVSKDRTKFFDFIIPIVPIIDSSNSYDQFIEHFKQGGIFGIFDKNFLQGLSLYVDDMRILKNIYNEFTIYQNRIQSTELNSNKLLAIITYKNIFPRDFSDLQLGLGFVHTLFENKYKFVEKEVQVLDNRIQRNGEEIDLISNELLKSIDELNAVFLKSNHKIYEVNGKRESNFKTRVELVAAIKESPDSVYSYNQYYNHMEKVDIDSEFEQLLQNPEYISRKGYIEKRISNQIERLKDEIQKLKKKRTSLKNGRLRDIITKDNIHDIFSVTLVNAVGDENKFEEIKTSSYFPLIKYLLRNGYIDETYPDYMTYFYENSLSRIDKIFLRSVTDQIPKEYHYSLKDPKLVLSRVRLIDFDQEEILNFDLFSYLLESKSNNEIYLIQFLNHLKRTKNYKFISEFLKTKRLTNVFIESINHFWPDIFQGILTATCFSEEQKKQYVIDTLYFSSDASIKALNVSDCLSKFISNCADFLNIDNPDISRLINGFSLINVKFVWIKSNSSNKELFNAVYRNNQYQLTFQLISLMLERVYNFNVNDDFKTQNYTLILRRPNEPLLAYVNNQISNYINIILDNCDKNITDEEVAAMEILNNEEVELDKKKEYISFLQTVIEHIEKVISKELWDLLLQQKLVKYSENNILNYFFYSEKGLDSVLIQFLNAFSDDLSFEYDSINNIYGDNSASKFYNAIVTCNQLSSNKYKDILISLSRGSRGYNLFTYDDIEEEKITILIEIGVLRMTQQNLSFMRENYPTQIMRFVIKNITKYVDEIIDEDNLDYDEMLSILEENIADRYKIDLLKKSTEKISIQQKRYSDIVKIHILENNLDENDIPFLLKNFSHESNNVKKVIKDIAIEYINKIITEEYSVSFDMLSQLFSSDDLVIDQKMKLFAILLPQMDQDQAKEYLQTLKRKDLLSLFDQKRPKFIINSTNKQILVVFEQKNWITKFETGNDYFRAFGRKAGEK